MKLVFALLICASILLFIFIGIWQLVFFCISNLIANTDLRSVFGLCISILATAAFALAWWEA